MFVPDKAGKIALTIFVLVLNRISQIRSSADASYPFPQLRRNAKRELHLSALLRNHLLADIPCSEFSPLIRKKSVPANWKKDARTFPPNLFHCRYSYSIRKFAKQDLLK